MLVEIRCTGNAYVCAYDASSLFKIPLSLKLFFAEGLIWVAGNGAFRFKPLSARHALPPSTAF